MESQSFTIKDARTRLKEERINLEIDEQIEYEQRRDARTQHLHDTMWNPDIPYKERVKQIKDAKDVSVPTYPEPEGDPSY